LLRLLADENFTHDVVRGLIRHPDQFDIVVTPDEMLGADDPTILEWAAQENRIVLTHDVNTMTGFAWARVTTGKPMPGLFVVSNSAKAGAIIDDLLMIEACSQPGEYANRVEFLPM